MTNQPSFRDASPTAPAKEELLAALRQSGAEFVQEVAALPAQSLEQGRYENGWDARQILAHVAAIEWTYANLIDIARQADPSGPTSAGDAPPTRTIQGGMDAYNARQVEKRARATVEELLDEFARNRQKTIAAVEATPEPYSPSPSDPAAASPAPSPASSSPSPSTTSTNTSPTSSASNSRVSRNRFVIEIAHDGHDARAPVAAPETIPQEVPSMNDFQQLAIETLESQLSQVSGLGRHFPANALDQELSPGGWTARQHFDHVRSIEGRYLQRLEGVLAKGGHIPPPPVAPDPTTRQPLEDLVSEFTDTRKRMLALLRALPEADWQRVFNHPTIWGDVTVEWWAERAIQHTADHLQSLWMLRQLSAVSEDARQRAATL